MAKEIEDRYEQPSPVEGPKHTCIELDMAQIEIETLAEDAALFTVEKMLTQVLIGVKRCRRTADAGVYNKFNADKFIENLEKVQEATKKMFPGTQ